MATPTTGTALSMKLLVDSKAERVLFAEAGKDVVDFLFSLLALPVATAVELLGKESMVGCVGSLYASVEKLDGTYVVQPGAAKDALLRPTVLSPAASSLLVLPAGPSSSFPDQLPAKPFYRCNSQCSSGGGHGGFGGGTVGGFGGGLRVGSTSGGFGIGSTSGGTCNGCRSYMTDTSGTACPSCGSKMTTAVQLVAGSLQKAAAVATGVGANKGFVQGIVTYTVMDDLAVAPMSAISGIAKLSSVGVTDLGSLQEKTVQLGYKEGLEILKASLQSKTVLTDVFLAN